MVTIGLKVLSLFDGMAGGRIAFKELDIPVDKYIAYEIDKYAIKAATHNFPEIEEKGDVFDADFTKYKGVDFLVGGSPCFTKGHMVLTDKGYKDISEIEIGDMVLTHKNRYKPVTRLYERKAKTVKLKIKGYPEFETTENHPFYTITRKKKSYAEYKGSHTWRKFTQEPTWLRVDEMTKDTFCGEHIHVPSNNNPYGLTEEECYILGRYVADGHLRLKKRKERNNSYHYQLLLSIGAKKLEEFKGTVKNNHFSCYPHAVGVYRCVFSSQRLVEIANEFGRGARNKEIPEFVYNLPLALIGAFIRGYMQGDGCYSRCNDSYYASTVSKTLAFGLQRLLTSYYHSNVGVSCSNNEREHYIGERKIVGKGEIYTLTFKTELKKQSVAHIQDNIMWTAFVSAKPTGKEKTVYNIEVKDDNSYTVNNCIVHNCTYWSIAQKNNRETEASGMGWELFCQYVRALKEVKPKYFIYENNKSMSKAIRDSIRETFGFEEICINSSLVSAQNRQRFYWAGIRNPDGTYRKARIEQPEDRGILLKDIINDGFVDRDKSYCLKHQQGNARDYFKKRHTQIKFEPVGATVDGKSYCITAVEHKGTNVRQTIEKHRRSMIAEPVRVPDYKWEDKSRPVRACYAYKGSGSGSLKTEAFPADSNKQKSDYVAEPINTTPEGKSQTIKGQYVHTSPRNICCYTSTYGASGVGEPVRVGCLPSPDGTIKGSQANRIYSIIGKSVNLVGNGGGLGAKTGLYAIPISFDTEGIPLKAVSAADGKTYDVYEVKDGQIKIKDVLYPIKLSDGYWIIRKLTVAECKKLQTIPDWYDMTCVSDTRGYQLLGNGWTIQVICHIISSMMKEDN